MEATVAERGQITLPKAVRDALGLTKGTKLKVELEGGRIVLRKDVDDALSRVRGRFKLPEGLTTDDAMRELRGRAPGRPLPAARGRPMIACRSSVLVDLLGDDAHADASMDTACAQPCRKAPSWSATWWSEVVAGWGTRSSCWTRSRDGHRLLAERNCARPCAPARCSAATTRRGRRPRREPRTWWPTS
jgi:antitoxin PrlF